MPRKRPFISVKKTEVKTPFIAPFHGQENGFPASIFKMVLEKTLEIVKKRLGFDNILNFFEETWEMFLPFRPRVLYSRGMQV